jgi:hypothetical protein
VPSELACGEVARRLGFLRERLAERGRPEPDPARRARWWARRMLRELRALERMPRDDLPPAAALLWLGRVSRWRAWRASVEQLLPTLAPDQRERRAWHAEAEGLVRLFRRAMASANPGRRYGATAQGPAVRFVRSALALAWGDAPGEHAIAQHLRRRRAGRPPADLAAGAASAPPPPRQQPP